MIQTQLLKLVKALSPSTTLVSGWDKELPKYAELKLNDAVLTVAKCEEKYVLSVIKGNSVKSVLVSRELSDEEIARAISQFDSPLIHDSAHSSSTSTGNKQRSSPIANVRGYSREVRDPNAPPGFEDEHLLQRPEPEGPTLEFDPDRDIYPPGGRHPELSPFAPFGSSRGSGGMKPSPFGISKPRNIRDDPTSPFGSGQPPFGL